MLLRIRRRYLYSNKLNVKIVSEFFVDLNNTLPFNGEIDDLIV